MPPRRSGRTRTQTKTFDSEVDDEPVVKRAKTTKPRAAPKSKAKAKAPPPPKDDSDDDSQVQTKSLKLKAGSSAPVDSNCHLADRYHVYQDADGPWDFVGNQTNIGNNNNKFYILQLLESDDKKHYKTWTRWGRVGLVGQSKILPGDTLDACKASFCKKFNDKTKNDWYNRANFEKRAGKYDMVLVDYGAEAEQVEKHEKALSKKKKQQPKTKSKLDERVKSLIELIFDVKAMTAAVVELKYDVKKMPLGKLTSQQIKAGYESLKEIEELIQSGASRGQLSAASSEFYTRIPHVFGMKPPTVIATLEMVKEKNQLLEALSDIKAAMKLIDEQMDDDTPEVDRHYSSLNCGISPLEPGSDEFEMIETYMNNTHGSTHRGYSLEILDAFTLDKDTKFKPGSNHQLLWHGSRLTNWAGILSQGLRIAPPEAPVTGYMFGKGVYFADACSKSANYCFTNRRNNVGILLLCEVALGTPFETLSADCLLHQHLPKGKHSTHGKGQQAPDPKQTIDFDGMKVPLGKLKKTGVTNPAGFTLQYNEFIVYNTKQVRFRYLLKCKFNYK